MVKDMMVYSIMNMARDGEIPLPLVLLGLPVLGSFDFTDEVGELIAIFNSSHDIDRRELALACLYTTEKGRTFFEGLSKTKKLEHAGPWVGPMLKFIKEEDAAKEHLVRFLEDLEGDLKTLALTKVGEVVMRLGDRSAHLNEVAEALGVPLREIMEIH